MLIPSRLKKGSKIAIVSLSWGILGDPSSSFCIDLGVKRMKEMGLEPVFMPNALKGEKFIQDNPDARASDLKAAFADKNIDGIFCAIGGNDTFRTLPFLIDDPEFDKLVHEHPKVFMGYSDTTVNHLMFYKLGLQSYYGPSFLDNFADYGKDMLEYTKESVKTLFYGHTLSEIHPAPLWFENRKDFSESQLGVPRISHKEEHGFELLQGDEGFSGELIGGCLESISDLLTGDCHPEEKVICDRYGIFPEKDELHGKVLFIETCEECPSPEKFAYELEQLKKRGVFEAVNGVIVGKPYDEIYYEEYKPVLKRVIDDSELPILYNVNFGHSHPKTILPYGAGVICLRDRIVFI